MMRFKVQTPSAKDLVRAVEAAQRFGHVIAVNCNEHSFFIDAETAERVSNLAVYGSITVAKHNVPTVKSELVG